MNLKPVILALALTAGALQGGALHAAPDCDALYARAESACRATRSACNTVKICDNLSRDCALPATDSASCGALNACAYDATPTFFDTACRYEWTGGACRTTNSNTEDVTPACPSASASVPQSCAASRQRYLQAAADCDEAAMAYARALTCSRPVSDLYVRECNVPGL
nr:hypothetical protein [uncultured Celeribacter sp.]